MTQSRIVIFGAEDVDGRGVPRILLPLVPSALGVPELHRFEHYVMRPLRKRDDSPLYVDLRRVDNRPCSVLHDSPNDNRRLRRPAAKHVNRLRLRPIRPRRQFHHVSRVRLLPHHLRKRLEVAHPIRLRRRDRARLDLARVDRSCAPRQKSQHHHPRRNRRLPHLLAPFSHMQWTVRHSVYLDPLRVPCSSTRAESAARNVGAQFLLFAQLTDRCPHSLP